MRKRLVVVCVAASAVVLGSGIVATTAGAEQRPDVPGLPGFTMPELPGFGDDSDAGFGSDLPDAGPFGAVPDADPAGARPDGDSGGTRPDGDSGGTRPDGDSGGARPDGDSGGTRPDGDPAGPRPHAGVPGSRPDADSAGSRPDAGSADSRPGSVDAGDADPDGGPNADQVRPKPAGRPHLAPIRERPAPDGPGHAQQPAGVLASSREAVTAADVSSSPFSPVQQQVLALVNQNRRRGGCGGLTLDRRLIEAANEHAADMARRRYLAHESPNGDRAGDRVRGAGYRWKRYGENIARGADSPYEVVDGWMHSPEHRENIMDCDLRQMGVGLAMAGDTPYWVQNFATPMT